MTPEEIRKRFRTDCVASTNDVVASALAEIAAQLAELNGHLRSLRSELIGEFGALSDRFSDFFTLQGAEK